VKPHLIYPSCAYLFLLVLAFISRVFLSRDATLPLCLSLLALHAPFTSQDTFSVHHLVVSVTFLCAIFRAVLSSAVLSTIAPFVFSKPKIFSIFQTCGAPRVFFPPACGAMLLVLIIVSFVHLSSVLPPVSFTPQHAFGVPLCDVVHLYVSIIPFETVTIASITTSWAIHRV
jgi:hypothetical protein